MLLRGRNLVDYRYYPPPTGEDTATYCLFPGVAEEFFKEYYREHAKKMRVLEVEVMIGYSQ